MPPQQLGRSAIAIGRWSRLAEAEPPRRQATSRVAERSTAGRATRQPSRSASLPVQTARPAPRNARRPRPLLYGEGPARGPGQETQWHLGVPSPVGDRPAARSAVSNDRHPDAQRVRLRQARGNGGANRASERRATGNRPSSPAGQRPYRRSSRRCRPCNQRADTHRSASIFQPRKDHAASTHDRQSSPTPSARRG